MPFECRNVHIACSNVKYFSFQMSPIIVRQSNHQERLQHPQKKKQWPNNYFKMHREALGTTFWQFHHALLHDGSSHNWHLLALIKAQNKVVTFWKKCFRWFLWQRSWFRDSASKEVMCKQVWVWMWQRTRLWAANADICNANRIQVKNSLYKLQHLFIDDVIV